MWSISEEAARRRIADCIDQEQGWVPRRGRESWLGLMWEVQSLRRGAVFGRSHEWITLSEGGALATKDAHGGFHTAASKVSMRAGRHYAEITVMSGSFMFFGVVRPGWGLEGGENAHLVAGHCFYFTASGGRYPDGYCWEGMQAYEGSDYSVTNLEIESSCIAKLRFLKSNPRCRPPPAAPPATPPTSSPPLPSRRQSSSPPPLPTPAICSASPAHAGASRSSASPHRRRTALLPAAAAPQQQRHSRR